VKQWIASYAVVGLGLMALWVLLIFVPLHKQLARLEIQTLESQRQLEDFKSRVSQLPQFIQARQKLIEQKAFLSSKLYTKGDILKLFEQLERQAQNEGLAITEISPPIEELLYLNSVVPDSIQPQFLNFDLKLEGNYINFGRFVGHVEKSDYFRGVNECQIMGGKETRNADGYVQFQLGLKALLGSFKEKS
jgi:Tfp pilus assembly protein PilO